MIARHAEHLVAGISQPLEELAGLLELLGPRALREVAADDDEVGLLLVDALVDRLDQPRVVGAEVKVGQMDQAGHETATRWQPHGSPLRRRNMDRTEANTGTREVSERLRFDEAALDRLDGRAMSRAFAARSTVSQFKGGQSNPTYRIDTAPAAYVLRRKPPGKLLPGAHAVDREYRVIAALGAQGFPVPRVYGLCEDESVIGTPFFVMDMVRGPDRLGSAFPGLSREERAAHFDAMNATIAAASQLRSGGDRARRLRQGDRLRRTPGRALVEAISDRHRRGPRSRDGPAGRLARQAPSARQRPLQRRPRRLSLRQHDLRRRERRSFAPSSTGNCRRSAIRPPTSPITC